MEYHIYCINESNRVTARHISTASSDLDALDVATKLCTAAQSEMEVWQGPRFVARLARDGTASNAIPKPREDAA